jgi:hypothetical protein
MLTGGAKKLFIGLMCLFALAIVVVLIRQVYTASQKKKEEAAAAAGEVFFKEPSNPARLFSKLYNAALWGMIIALICARVPKLAATINLGWIFFGAWLGVFAVVLIFRKFKCGIVFTAANVVISLGIIYFLCHRVCLRYCLFSRHCRISCLFHFYRRSVVR